MGGGSRARSLVYEHDAAIEKPERQRLALMDHDGRAARLPDRSTLPRREEVAAYPVAALGLRAHDDAEACYVDWLDFSLNRGPARLVPVAFFRIHCSCSGDQLSL
jgi:hypothetical protein